MLRRCRLHLFILLSLTPLARAQSMLPGGDFEGGLSGWEPVAADGVSVVTSADKPAQGRSCLQLQTTGKAPAWVLSPALTGPGDGELALLSFTVRRGAGQSGLMLDIVGGAAELGEAVIWEARVPEDTNWHKVSLLLRIPPVRGGGAPRLAFAATGAAGSWFLDDVNVTKGSLPTPAIQPLPGEPANTGRLPEGWQPEGYLDAIAKEVGTEQELSITANGLLVTIRPTLSCYRGFREGAVVYGVNRGKVDKELQVQVEAPPEVESPAWTVPIQKDGTTRFHIAVQCLRQGDFTLRLNFASGPDRASAPLRVHCHRCYPALGVRWEGPPTAEDLQRLARTPVDMHLLVGPSDPTGFAAMAEPLLARGADVLAAPDADGLPEERYGAVLAQLGSLLNPSFWVPYTLAGNDPLAAALAAPRFASVQRARVREAGVLSPPVPLRRTWPDGKLAPERPDLVATDKMAGLMAVTVRPPRLGAACVVAEQVDGKADVPGGAMAALGRQADLESVRQLLTERQVNLPMLVDGLQARSAGDPRLDALHLARALTMAFYQGSTGVVLSPRRDRDNAFGIMPAQGDDDGADPVLQAMRAVSAELMGATPIVALAATPDVNLDASAAISFRPFLRGGEGILVLWNNTGVSRDVAIEFRSQPVVGHYTRLSYHGDFLQRSWAPIFRFGEEAFQRKRPLLIMRVNPLEVQLMAFRLLAPHAAWLRTVELAKPYVAPKDAMPPVREEWWLDMLKVQPFSE